MVPAVAEVEPQVAWSASRPLIEDDDPTDDPQQISRSFACWDHGRRDGLEGLVSLIGGKATTLRAMAEAAADRICELTGRRSACRTREVPLHPYRHYYR